MTSLGRVVLGLTIVCMTAGCASIELQRQYFKDERDRCIGQIAALGHRCGWWEPAAVRAIDEHTEEFQYRDEDCEWTFEVDRESKVVKSWHYISDPARCYIKTDWLGAW